MRVPVDLLVAGILVVVAAAVATTAVLTRDIRFRRRVRRLRTTAIAELSEGKLVKVVGVITASTGHELRAAISDDACVYYHVWHEEKRETYINGARFEKWVDAGEEEDACEFQLRDATGILVVRARDRDSFPTVSLRPDAYHQQELEGGQARAREATLRVGQTVAVIGIAQRTIDPNAAALYRELPEARVLAPPPAGALLITDVDPG